MCLYILNHERTLQIDLLQMFTFSPLKYIYLLLLLLHDV